MEQGVAFVVEAAYYIIMGLAFLAVAMGVEALITTMMKKPTICAWCLAEKGELAKAGDSHGICKRHMDECLTEYENGK